MSALPAGVRRQEDARALQLASVARDLAGRGEAQQALALVRAELEQTPEQGPRATLLFTLGWLEHQIADQDRARRVLHLEQAETWYTQGLELAPSHTPARANLALVQGDLALERGQRDDALAHWRRALDLAPEDNAAAAGRFLNLLGSDARALAAEARRLEVAGHVELSREAWARVIAATPAEAQGEPALRWLLLAGESNRFTRDSVDGFAPGGAALAELRLLARDSLRAPVPSWAGSALGRHAVAQGFRSLAAEQRGGGDPAAALALLERGLALAPRPPVVGRRPARLDLALDAAELLLEHPEIDPRGERFDALSSLLLLDDADNSNADLATRQRYHAAIGQLLAGRDRWSGQGIESAAYHLRLAIDLRREMDRGVAANGASEHPLPELSMLLASGLLRIGDLEGAMEAYLDASEGYLAMGARADAENALLEAQAIAASLGGSERALAVEASLRGNSAFPEVIEPLAAEAALVQEPELDAGTLPSAEPAGGSFSSHDGLIPRLLSVDGLSFGATTRAGAFAPERFYAGAGLGAAWLSTSEGSVEGDLADLSYDVGVDVDGAAFAYRIYGGYRFRVPLAVELGYTDLGTIDSRVGPEPAGPLDQFLDDLADTHPAPGNGPTLALRGLLYGNDVLALGLKLGVWYWEADVDVETSTSSVSLDRDGFDPFYGLDLGWKPLDWGSVRLDLERYAHDEADTNFVTLGIELELDRLFENPE